MREIAALRGCTGSAVSRCRKRAILRLRALMGLFFEFRGEASGRRCGLRRDGGGERALAGSRKSAGYSLLVRFASWETPSPRPAAEANSLIRRIRSAVKSLRSRIADLTELQTGDPADPMSGNVQRILLDYLAVRKAERQDWAAGKNKAQVKT